MKPAVVPGEVAAIILGGNPPQHLVALENANRIRLARARAKNDLHAGLLTLAEALVLDCMQTATVTSVLEVQDRWGHVRAEKACRQVPVSGWRRVGELTDRQRDRLVAVCAGDIIESDPFHNAA